jgi:hypothetical protein
MGCLGHLIMMRQKELDRQKNLKYNQVDSRLLILFSCLMEMTASAE